MPQSFFLTQEDGLWKHDIHSSPDLVIMIVQHLGPFHQQDVVVLV
jgi:hypothetical protein